MKKLKVNLMMVLALVIGVATMSFKLAIDEQVYHYTDAVQPGNFANPANWSPGGEPGGCEEGTTLPCEITIGENENLTDVLQGRTNPEVLTMADNTKD